MLFVGGEGGLVRVKGGPLCCCLVMAFGGKTYSSAPIRTSVREVYLPVIDRLIMHESIILIAGVQGQKRCVCPL